MDSSDATDAAQRAYYEHRMNSALRGMLAVSYICGVVAVLTTILRYACSFSSSDCTHLSRAFVD
jgi:hypothetical protein